MSYVLRDTHGKIITKVECFYDLNGTNGCIEFPEPEDGDFHTLDDDIQRYFEYAGFTIEETPEIVITMSGGCIQEVDFQGNNEVDIVFRDYDIEEPEQLIAAGDFDIRTDGEGDYYQHLVWESK